MRVISLALLSLCVAHSDAFAPSPVKHVTKSQAPSSSSTLRMAASNNPFDFLSGLLPKQNNDVKDAKPKIPDVVIDSDFTLSYVFGALGIFILLTSPASTCAAGSGICPPSVWGAVQGGLNILFASFLAVQAKRIRFVFDETAFELKNVDIGTSSDEVLKESGENFVVGGANRWDYDSFVNFDFFPSVDYPILVYFKETQTSSESWNEGPGQLDKVGGGQIHFFPAIANVKQLKEQFELRNCAKVEK
jgi:hypothetical protein